MILQRLNYANSNTLVASAKTPYKTNILVHLEKYSEVQQNNVYAFVLLQVSSGFFGKYWRSMVNGEFILKFVDEEGVDVQHQGRLGIVGRGAGVKVGRDVYYGS